MITCFDFSNSTLTEDLMWAAVASKNPEYNGVFYTGVLSTGIFCKPSCPARQPLRKNVRFFCSTEEAIEYGLRACKRCDPTSLPNQQLDSIRFLEICRAIESRPDEAFRLDTLAKMAGLSPSHFQRRFKAAIGISPRQYQEACRLGTLKQVLQRGVKNVTAAVYEVGFGSGSRVYEKLDTHLGMTPRQYQKKGKGLQISYASVETTFGCLMMGATDRGLCFIQFGFSEAELLAVLKKEFSNASIAPMILDKNSVNAHQFERWIQSLESYLAGEKLSLDLPLDIQGTAFQRKVWGYLQKIPYGQVRSYSEVAIEMGQPKAARAVASACAANNLAIIIPCHRVIRGSGELSGYRWGLEMKRALIETEKRIHISDKDADAKLL